MIEPFEPDCNGTRSWTYSNQNNSFDNSVARLADMRCCDAHRGTLQGDVLCLSAASPGVNRTLRDEAINVLRHPPCYLVEISHTGKNFAGEESELTNRVIGVWQFCSGSRLRIEKFDGSHSAMAFGIGFGIR